MPRAVFFDDGGGSLAPLTDLRPSFDLRVGALTNMERLVSALGLQVASLWTPRGLTDLTRDTHDLPVNALPAGEDLLLINGRCPVPAPEITGLQPGQSLREEASGELVAARADAATAEKLLAGEAAGAEERTLGQEVLLRRPWQFRTVRDLAIALDLELLAGAGRRDLPTGVVVVGERAVAIDPQATVYPNVTLVAEDGPIWIGPRSTVRPGATIIGPAAIGRGSTVVEHAVIRPNTSLGPVCKVGGEVSGTVFQGYSNKAHDGYLGDSWVGEWVNLGAATTGSNLLNTYGEVFMQAEPGGKRERTGETFLGAIIGDHVKTAIGTRIMTGAILHTGSMFAQSEAVSGTVARFTWATDAGARPYRLSKFLEVMQTAMGRRDIEPSEAYLARVRELHGWTDEPS